MKKNERTFDDFDAYAGNYRALHTQNIKLSGADSFYFAEMKVRLLQGYETNSIINVLDIGCGDGTTEMFIQKYFPQWKVFGIDVSEKSIEAAQQINLTNADFQVYDGIQIPFKNEMFDLVFIAGVLHHIEFNLHDNLIKEINRVLKTGGKLLLFEHNPLNPLTRYLVSTCIFDKTAKLLSYRYTTKLLLKNNFKTKEKIFLIFFPRKGLFKKFIFLEKYLQWLPLGGQYFFRAIK